MARVDKFSRSKNERRGKLSQRTRKKERQDCTYAKMSLDGHGERKKEWEKEALVAIKCNYLPGGQVFVDDVF